MQKTNISCILCREEIKIDKAKNHSFKHDKFLCYYCEKCKLYTYLKSQGFQFEIKYRFYASSNVFINQDDLEIYIRKQNLKVFW